MLVGDEICTGLSNGAIDHIVKNFHNIITEEQLLERGITSIAFDIKFTEVIVSLQG